MAGLKENEMDKKLDATHSPQMVPRTLGQRVSRWIWTVAILLALIALGQALVWVAHWLPGGYR